MENSSGVRLLLGDCQETLKGLAENSVDAVVTDSPYGLKFMGKKWDYEVPSIEIWKEVLRVLKPGGHVLSFCGTRTYHRMVVNMEDAGFEIRDQIQWIYGSGFPKSHDISKGIDKAAGAEREQYQLSGKKRAEFQANAPKDTRSVKNSTGSGIICSICNCTSVSAATGMLACGHPKDAGPVSDLAKKAQGWGTALKPANEPICLARKPLIGTVAKNFETFGVGGLNIDASRIASEFTKVRQSKTTANIYGGNSLLESETLHTSSKDAASQGRWPANVIFDEEAAALLDEQTQDLKGAGSARGKGQAVQTNDGAMFGIGNHDGNGMRFGDSGGASRFFYIAKASKRERNAGLEGMPQVESGIKNDSGRGFSESDPHKKILNQNFHPTVKPIKLMQYLIRMVTPIGGTVLDPFMGSGTTGCAAKSLGFQFIGCEMSAEYFEIARKRIEHWAQDEILEQREMDELVEQQLELLNG